MFKIYGIKNCSTVKKALEHLDRKKIKYEFVDFKKYQPTVTDIQRWSLKFGALPVNKQGQTYKKIKEQYDTSRENKKIEMIQNNSSVIKRPILEKNEQVLLFGYDEDFYDKLK